MGVDFASLAYQPNFEVFARPVTITPLFSQPGMPAYSARGIFDTEDFEVPMEDGSIFSDQRPILDIIEAEFAILPRKGDQIDIADDAEGPGPGSYVVVDVSSNSIETTLNLRKLGPAKPAFSPLV
jgi:hypothetical protein